jgi:hypothetical protein
MTESEFSEAVGAGVHLVPGQKARSAASIFNYGNIVAIIVPVPLGMLWLGLSMLVYAMNRHHPNEKVGFYTQQAAYRFYGIAGFFVAAATFIPGGGWNYYLAAWAVAALILVPWSIVDLIRIRRDHWEDLELPVPHHEPSSHEH